LCFDRNEDGTGYYCGFANCISECWCQHICPCGGKGKSRKRERSSVIPINARPEDYEESEMILPDHKKPMSAQVMNEKRKPTIGRGLEGEEPNKKTRRSHSLPVK